MPAALPLSVILVCHNPGPLLPTALASIWEQLHVQPEIIVVDRGSSDGSLAWLESQRPRLTAVLTAPAANVFAAMAQGVAVATGEWLLFLGAEDRLVGDLVLSETVGLVGKTEAGVAAGEVAYDDGRIARLGAHVNPCARNFVPRSAAFYRRTLFTEHAAFDSSLTAMAGYDFNVRLWQDRVRFKPLPLRITASAAGPVADARRWRGYREEIAVRHRYFPFARCLLWDALTLVRFFRQRFSRHSLS